MKKKKYTLTEYVKADRALKQKADDYIAKIQARRNKLAVKFIDDNSPVKIGKVYELIEGGIKRRGYNRFLVVQQRVTFFDNKPMIGIGGYWINKISDVAEKWDGSLVVLGVGNPAVFKLSGNQKHIINTDTKRSK